VFALGRARCDAGDAAAAAETLELAIEKAEATGDLRLAALARVQLGRARIALGQDASEVLDAAERFHRTAGGGEGAPLLAALRSPPRDHPAG
jgi:hypothetical protein